MCENLWHLELLSSGTCKLVQIQCSFTSKWRHRDRTDYYSIRDGEPRTATSTFTQLLSSVKDCTAIERYDHWFWVVTWESLSVWTWSRSTYSLIKMATSTGDKWGWSRYTPSYRCLQLYTPSRTLRSLFLILSASSSLHQTLYCLFPCLLCLRSLYTKWPSPSSPTESLSGLIQVKTQNNSFAKTIDLPCFPFHAAVFTRDKSQFAARFKLYVN